MSHHGNDNRTPLAVKIGKGIYSESKTISIGHGDDAYDLRLNVTESRRGKKRLSLHFQRKDYDPAAPIQTIPINPETPHALAAPAPRVWDRFSQQLSTALMDNSFFLAETEDGSGKIEEPILWPDGREDHYYRYLGGLPKDQIMTHVLAIIEGMQHTHTAVETKPDIALNNHTLHDGSTDMERKCSAVPTMTDTKNWAQSVASDSSTPPDSTIKGK